MFTLAEIVIMSQNKWRSHLKQHKEVVELINGESHVFHSMKK